MQIGSHWVTELMREGSIGSDSCPECSPKATVLAPKCHTGLKATGGHSGAKTSDEGEHQGARATVYTVFPHHL